MKADINDCCTSAAFMMEGLCQHNYQRTLDAWDNGAVELVSQLVEYAPKFSALVDAVLAADPDTDFPGVIDYEVCSPFGGWFGQYVIKHGTTPPTAEAMAWLAKETIFFFTPGAEADDIARITQAVESATKQQTIIPEQPKAIPKGYETNFTTMLQAARAGHLALVSCTDKQTGRPVYAVCAVNRDSEEFVLAPFAKMFDGNPYDELNPPV